MAAVYPGSIASIASNKVDATTTPTDHPDHHNQLAEEVVAVETALGTDPAGPYATVADRLDAVDGLTTTDPADIYWDGTTAAGLTTVTVTGSQTITEGIGLLSVAFKGLTTGDVNALLSPHTFSVGDAFTVPVRALTVVGPVNTLGYQVGLLFTDGTAATSNVVFGHLQSTTDAANPRLLVGRHGTLTSATTAPWVSNAQVDYPLPAVWIRLKYQAANTFRLEFSPDGLSWSAFGESDISKTMTPTHVGLGWAAEVNTYNSIGTYGPIRKVA